MFNILGFHVSAHGEGNENDNIRAVNDQLDSLYKRTNKDDDEDFLERKEFGDIYDLLDLQSDDLRILMRAEEEISQAKMFSRIFPNKDYKQLGIHREILLLNSLTSACYNGWTCPCPRTTCWRSGRRGNTRGVFPLSGYNNVLRIEDI